MLNFRYNMAIILSKSQKLWLSAQDLHKTGPVNTLSWKGWKGESFMGMYVHLMVHSGGRKIFLELKVPGSQGGGGEGGGRG